MRFYFSFLKHIDHFVIEGAATVTNGNFVRLVNKQVVDVDSGIAYKQIKQTLGGKHKYKVMVTLKHQ